MEQKEAFSNIDTQFANLIKKLDARESDEVFEAAALASFYARAGHIFVEIEDERIEYIRQSRCVGGCDDYAPLILQDNKLYLYRYWKYKKNFSEYIEKTFKKELKKIDINIAKKCLKIFFDFDDSYEITAGLSALLKYFVVITGGPGAGKTSIAAKILGAVIFMNKTENFKIALAAPTGKAAARLKESIGNAKKFLDVEKEILGKIPEDAYTIHRLLGKKENSSAYFYNAENPIPFNMILIDEASMIDIELMSSFIDALLPDTLLIMLGDKDQLSSVQPGSVFADICGNASINAFSKDFISIFNKISDRNFNLDLSESEKNVIEFKRSFRFSDESGIKLLSDAINRNKPDEAFDILRKDEFYDLKWIDIKDNNSLYDEMQDLCITKYRDYLQNNEPEKCIANFSKFKILCAIRAGSFGASGLNEFAEHVLEKEGLINREDSWYHKKPILITKNDYDLNLFNGDTGITFKDSYSRSFVFFPLEHGKVKKIFSKKILYYETSYAITVHKSQGSEFDEILLVLPDKESSVLTKELLYTAVTRAKNKVIVIGSERIFKSSFLSADIKRRHVL